VPGLFDTATSSNLSKQEDGSYGARLSGALGRLKPRPLSAAARRSSKADSGSGSAASRRRASRNRKNAATDEPEEETSAETEETE
jgi:hypothetical protein